MVTVICQHNLTSLLSLLTQGVIISLKDNEGIIKSDEHGELPFDVKENFSDVEFTAEDIKEEVEFTVIQVRMPLWGGFILTLSGILCFARTEIKTVWILALKFM